MSSTCNCVCSIQRWHLFVFALGGVAVGLVLSFVIQYIALNRRQQQQQQQHNQRANSDLESYMVVENVDGLTKELAQNNVNTQKMQTIELRKMGSRKLKDALQQGSTQVTGDNQSVLHQNKKAMDSIVNLLQKSSSNTKEHVEQPKFGAGTVVQWASGTMKGIRKLSTRINRDNMVEYSANSKDFKSTGSFSQMSRQISGKLSVKESLQEQLQGALVVETPVVYQNESEDSEFCEEEEVKSSRDSKDEDNVQGGSLIVLGSFSKRRDIWV